MCHFDLDELRDAYVERQASHKLCCDALLEKISCLTKDIKPRPELRTRIKNIDSFIFKAIGGQYKNPLLEIKDQIGLRIVVTYEKNLEEIDKIIQREFAQCNREDKLYLLKPDQLGYLGIHYTDLKFSNEEAQGRKYAEHSESVCEIKLRTSAQHAWATVSHELSYKPSIEPPLDAQRSIYRLVALVELFDREVSNAQKVIYNNTSNYPEAHLLSHLENQICLFSSRKTDKNFSLKNLEFLKESLTQEEIENFELLIKKFVAKNREKLDLIFGSYAEDQRSSYKISMLFQPESLLVFERLEESSKYDFLDLWKKNLPTELLEFLGTVWASDIVI